MLAAYTSSPTLTDLPIEPFIDATVGKSQKKWQYKSPVDTIIALCRLARVSQALMEKVEGCWISFIRLADQRSLLISPLSKRIDFTSKDFIIQQFPVWKYMDFEKLCNATPTITECTLPGFVNQCIAINSIGIPELWAKLESDIIRKNLMTGTSSPIKLYEGIRPFSNLYNSCIALSRDWVAICTEASQESQKIIIVDINSGAFCHKISKIGNIEKMHCEGQYLYILCSEKHQSKLVQYDSNDWDAPPKKLHIPEMEVLDFYSVNSEWLFLIGCGETVYQLSAVEKDSCFSNPKPFFCRTDPLNYYPRFESTENGFLTISRAPDSTHDMPLASLERLLFENSVIKKEYFQTLPLDIKEMSGFHVLADKIFIRRRRIDPMGKYDYSISCFDLSTGNFENNFVPKFTQNDNTFFRPVLIKLPDHSIQL